MLVLWYGVPNINHGVQTMKIKISNLIKASIKARSDEGTAAPVFRLLRAFYWPVKGADYEQMPKMRQGTMGHFTSKTLFSWKFSM
jgi:hypothetical protein